MPFDREEIDLGGQGKKGLQNVLPYPPGGAQND